MEVKLRQPIALTLRTHCPKCGAVCRKDHYACVEWGHVAEVSFVCETCKHSWVMHASITFNVACKVVDPLIPRVFVVQEHREQGYWRSDYERAAVEEFLNWDEPIETR